MAASSAIQYVLVSQHCVLLLQFLESVCVCAPYLLAFSGLNIYMEHMIDSDIFFCGPETGEICRRWEGWDA